MICAGCPYRLAALHLGKLHKRGDIEAIFGDIGCNTLIRGLNAPDVSCAWARARLCVWAMSFQARKPPPAA